MSHTIIPPPRYTAVTLELIHKGNVNDKTITERDREVRDFLRDMRDLPFPVVTTTMNKAL